MQLPASLCLSAPCLHRCFRTLSCTYGRCKPRFSDSTSSDRSIHVCVADVRCRETSARVPTVRCPRKRSTPFLFFADISFRRVSESSPCFGGPPHFSRRHARAPWLWPPRAPAAVRDPGKVVVGYVPPWRRLWAGLTSAASGAVGGVLQGHCVCRGSRVLCGALLAAAVPTCSCHFVCPLRRMCPS